VLDESAADELSLERGTPGEAVPEACAEELTPEDVVIAEEREGLRSEEKVTVKAVLAEDEPVRTDGDPSIEADDITTDADDLPDVS